MKTVSVEVHGDHLLKLAKVRPILAIEELIWNSLDADASEITVSFKKSLLGAIEQVSVSDNGTGISENEVETAFKNLGGSWKTKRSTTREEERILHGKEARGRFRAFALGEQVRWLSRYAKGDRLWELEVVGRLSMIKDFAISDPRPPSVTARRGTEVIVDPAFQDLPDLAAEHVVEDITDTFALYLTQYPAIRLNYNGTLLDPASLEMLRATYPVPPIVVDGERIDGAELTVVEWARPQRRSLCLCDLDGFTFGRVNPGIHAPGFSFSAYLRSDYLRELDRENSLEFGEMHAGAATLVVEAKNVLREHFRKRAADEATTLVEEWKKDDIYPYLGEPKSLVERTERQVFDVVAYNVASYMPAFAESDRKSKQLSFRLLRQALQENPRALQKILQEVVNLPKEAQDDLATLLERTSLTAVIEAAKTVSERLDFLAGLELLVFRPQSKKQLLERRELHRILANETWVFGEEFHLTVDDRSLNEVLARHLDRLRRETEETTADNEEPESFAPVLRADGTTGIVDLMLSRRIPQPDSRKRMHLIVELKRPAQTINLAAAQQILSYGFAIQHDERFRDDTTQWEFWAVSNRMTDEVRWMLQDQESGLYKTSQDGKMKFYIRTWGELTDECRGRLNFFQDRLQYAVDDDSALAYLRQTYNKYLPGVYKAETGEEVA